MHDLLSTGPRWYVISLRPRGGHARLRAAAKNAGHGFIALSPLRIVALHDDATRHALERALAADICVFTSPNAVECAATLMPLVPAMAIAIGRGTAGALQRAGVREVMQPSRMDSDGVLALPVLQAVAGRKVGLVTAPGGRDVLAPTLAGRGAVMLRADVYRRERVTLAPSALAALGDADGPLAIAVSSSDALDGALDQLDGELRARFMQSRVLAASDRLAAHARNVGFRDIVRADGPMPAQLVAALNRP